MDYDVTIKVKKLVEEKPIQGKLYGKMIKIISCEDCKELNGLVGKVKRDDDGVLYGTWHKDLPICADIDIFTVLD